jgi:hypothetical protein
MRRTSVDFPRPGLPRTNAEGLESRWARWNQLIGSQQTMAWERPGYFVSAPSNQDLSTGAGAAPACLATILPSTMTINVGTA